MTEGERADDYGWAELCLGTSSKTGTLHLFGHLSGLPACCDTLGQLTLVTGAMTLAFSLLSFRNRGGLFGAQLR